MSLILPMMIWMQLFLCQVQQWRCVPQLSRYKFTFKITKSFSQVSVTFSGLTSTSPRCSDVDVYSRACQCTVTSQRGRRGDRAQCRGLASSRICSIRNCQQQLANWLTGRGYNHPMASVLFRQTRPVKRVTVFVSYCCLNILMQNQTKKNSCGLIYHVPRVS